MKTTTFHGEILADGTLRIHVQTGLPPGPVEGVLVLHPVGEQPPLPHNEFENLLARDLPNIDLLTTIDEVPAGRTRQRVGQK